MINWIRKHLIKPKGKHMEHGSDVMIRIVLELTRDGTMKTSRDRMDENIVAEGILLLGMLDAAAKTLYDQMNPEVSNEPPTR
jgi:hypothetical protein